MLLELAPAWVIAKLGALSLIGLGYLVEKRYVGRVNLFANGMALNINYLPVSKTIPWYFGYYLDGGLLMGLLAILSYAQKRSMPKWFYALEWAYCSFVTGILVLFVQF